MSPAFDVVVLGSLHLDLLVEAPRLPALGETLPGTVWREEEGGKGRNQAVAAARAGARVAMVGAVGDDAQGERLRSGLGRHGVDAAAVRAEPGAPSGGSVAVLTEGGDYAAVIVSGANLGLGAGDVEAAAARLRRGGVLLLQNEVPEPVNAAAAARAVSLGATVILNAAPARPLGGPLAAGLDVLVVNGPEAEALAGLAVDDLDGALAAARALTALNRIVIVTAGAAGVAVAGRGAAFAHRGHPVAAGSAHGAGDVFTGVLAARLARGDTLQAASAFANAAAALRVSGADEADEAAIRRLIASGG